MVPFEFNLIHFSQSVFILVIMNIAVRQIDLELEYPCTVFHQLCYLMESKVGGTSGAVYGIFFAAMANAFEVINGVISLIRSN
jgi:hypothetical protein